MHYLSHLSNGKKNVTRFKVHRFAEYNYPSGA